MNSLAAMACGTVVIGGGEEDYYDFIGEQQLRPIINVSPELSDSENEKIIERAFFIENTLTRMSRESIEFVRKYHTTVMWLRLMSVFIARCNSCVFLSFIYCGIQFFLKTPLAFLLDFGFSVRVSCICCVSFCYTKAAMYLQNDEWSRCPW